jgi:SAM-dependent methyltransferase
MSEGYLQHISEHPEITAGDLRVIRKLAPEAKRALDIGSGLGGFVKACREAGIDAIGLDSEPGAARAARRERFGFALGDAFALPFRAQAFDIVRAKEIIEHLPDPMRLLSETRRVLRSDGLFVAHVPTHYSAVYPVNNFWDDYTHVRPFSRKALVRLLTDAGFDIALIRGYTAGRNAPERALGRALALVLPHTWLAVARQAQP